MNKKQKWILRLSVLINFIFLIIFLLNYTAYTYKLGVLKKDVKVGVFGNKDSVFFTLPKGLIVRDVSEQGLSAIDRFENNRFEIVITSDDSLVNYDVPKKELPFSDNLYSADNFKYK